MKRSTKPTYYLVLKTIDQQGVNNSRLIFLHLVPAWHNEMLRRLNRLRYFAKDLCALYHVYDIGTTDFYLLPEEVPMQWDGNIFQQGRDYGFVALSKQERQALPWRRSQRGQYELVVAKDLTAHYRTTAQQPAFRSVAFNLEQIVDPKIVEKHQYL